jgi:hypothetical protein
MIYDMIAEGRLQIADLGISRFCDFVIEVASQVLASTLVQPRGRKDAKE